MSMFCSTSEVTTVLRFINIIIIFIIIIMLSYIIVDV